MTNFPETPTLTDPPEEYSSGGSTWFYDGNKWVKKSASVTTQDVDLYDPSNPASVLKGSYGSTRKLPNVPNDIATQFDVNKWFVSALQVLDSHYDDASGGFVAGIHVGEDEPTEKENGTLWFDSSEDSLVLLLYYDPDGDPSTAAWIPAAPPVSAIEEINQILQGLDGELDLVTERVYNLNQIGEDSPMSPQDGYIWRDTTPGQERAYIYDGVLNRGWINLTPNSVVSGSAPTDSYEGDLWFDDENTETLYIYHDGSWSPITLGEAALERLTQAEEDIDTLESNQQTLQADVEELKVTKGSIARYQLGDILSSVQARPGEFNVSHDTASNVTSIYLNAEDQNGNVTRPVSVGDIIEVIDPLGTTVRYVSQSDTTLIMNVVHVSGDFGFVVDQQYDFYIYPMNEQGATKDYVDQQDDLKVSKSGDTINGVLNISSSGNANDDGVRLYMKNNTGDTTLTLFPSGVVTGKNVIRVNRDTGDAFQVKDSTGSSVKWKVNSAGTTYSPRVILTGGVDPNIGERVLDIQNGQAGRLSYNGQTKFTWGYSYVQVGPSTILSDPAISNFQLILAGHTISEVGKFQLEHSGSVEKKFYIKGENTSGVESEDFFYSYKTAAGTPDAMNYNGKMDNDYNLVNKKYVDDSVDSVNIGSAVQKTGDTMTGLLTLNNTSSNQQVNFDKGSNCDIQYKGNWIISLQGNDTPKIKVDAPLDMNNEKITNVANPSADKDAVNRKSLEGAKISAGSSGNTQSGGIYYSGGRLFYKI